MELDPQDTVAARNRLRRAHGQLAAVIRMLIVVVVIVAWRFEPAPLAELLAYCLLQRLSRQPPVRPRMLKRSLHLLLGLWVVFRQ